MTEQNGRPRKEAPSWWTPALYDYLEGMPGEGWVWEFMRRAKMLTCFKAKKLPVEAMKCHSRQGGKHLSPYWTWSQIIQSFPEQFKNVPAVRSHSARPASCDLFPLQLMFGLELYSAKILGPRIERAKSETVVIEVDLDRRDQVIKRDFQDLLAELRKKFPEPKKVFFLPKKWKKSHLLEVWDLRQYDVSWSRIQELFKLDKVHQARNAYTAATSYIDNGGWKDLHRSLGWIKGC